MLRRGEIAISIILACSAIAFAKGPASQVASQPPAPPMEKYVSKDAIFVLYKPQGWQVAEGGQPGFRMISVTDPRGLYEAAMFYGACPTGEDVPALAKLFLGGIGKQFPDLRLGNVMLSRDGKRVAFSVTFTNPQKGRREFQFWLSGAGREFMYAGVEAPEGKLTEQMPILLTILSNVRVFKGAFTAGQAAAPVQVELKPYRLSDGSASFAMPQNWWCRELGKGSFIAGDPSGGFAFTVASVDVITPQLGVKVPGVPVLPYLSPSRALQKLGAAQGSLTNMKFENVFPRADVAAQMAQVYTSGPVEVEEFIYTCDTHAGRCKGYTFGFSFGSRLGTNWNFRHLTVLAPADKFNAYTGTFAAMLQSYKIDQQWARNYIAQGIARLRQLQQQTAQIVARNAQEIHDMMQAAYDERQRSMDYIDYQRTNYIRGEQDWISGMEGGTVYHTDSWGAKNTTTGEYWNGQPYNYVNFDGRNPKHNEDMVPITNRQQWERYFP